MSSRPLSVQIAAEIRKQLFLRDMTATQLAERAGMTQPYISRRLTGATAFDVDDLQRIAAALDLDVADLLPAPAHRNGGPQRPSVHSSPAPNGGPPHAPNVRSSAQPPGRTPDTKRRGQRPAWTHAGVTS